MTEVVTSQREQVIINSICQLLGAGVPLPRALQIVVDLYRCDLTVSVSELQEMGLMP